MDTIRQFEGRLDGIYRGRPRVRIHNRPAPPKKLSITNLTETPSVSHSKRNR